MSDIDKKLSILQSLLAKNGSHHLFVRLHSREGHITGPLQGLTVNGNGTVTCFFGESLKTTVVDVPKSDLVDIIVFCNAERNPVFLSDFDGESGGEFGILFEVPAYEGIRQNLLGQARDEAVAIYQENLEVFESLRE